MDQKLKLQHKAETCSAIAFAVGAMLSEMIDDGAGSTAKLERTAIVLGLLQEKLEMVKRMADSAILNGLT